MSNKIEIINNIQIINEDNKKYIKKKTKTSTNKLFEYLKNKQFNYYPVPTEINNQYEIYPYIEETEIKEKKVKLIEIIGELHNKTTTYEEISEELINEIYQAINNEQTSLRTYYLDLQDYLETKEFPSPEAQLLLNNISNIYKAINFSEYKLSLWYEIIKSKDKIRKVQIHNNLSVANLIFNDKPYLINWDSSKRDIPIYDFINFYKNEFNNLEMNVLFEEYQEIFEYTEDEQLLFESIISIPPKITFKKTHLINTIEARKEINYIEKTNEFLLKKNKENQENNK